MSKKKKKKASGREVPSEETRREGGEALLDEKEAISPAGWKTIGGGVGLLSLGFLTLSFTDPQGRNWASTLSPFLILGAYAVIAFGIFQPEKTQEEDPVPSAAEPISSAPGGEVPKTSN